MLRMIVHCTSLNLLTLELRGDVIQLVYSPLHALECLPVLTSTCTSDPLTHRCLGMSSQQRQDLRGPCNNSRDCQGPTGTNRGCARSIFSMLATAALFTLLRPAAAKCGTQIFSQDFGKYSGAYQTWSEDLAAVDFHVGGAKRPSAAGDLLKPGIDIPSRGFENVNVGEGNMRLDFPKGVVLRVSCRYSALMGFEFTQHCELGAHGWTCEHCS